MVSNDFQNRITQLCETFTQLKRLEIEIFKSVELVFDCFSSRGKILLIGNGGSAAEAQHIAAEYVSSMNHKFKRKSLPAIALTTDTSFITAFGNDYGFDSIFERQIESLGQAGDILIAISTER